VALWFRRVGMQQCGAVPLLKRGHLQCPGERRSVVRGLGVSDKVWPVSFLHFDLGYFDEKEGRVEPGPSPFEAKVFECVRNNLLPMCPEWTEWTLKKLVAREGIEPPTRGFSVRCSTN
jgi:hypothetical protein